MVCKHCNNQINENVKYCTFCGHMVDEINVNLEQKVKLKLQNESEKVLINLSIPSIYKYNMSGKSLMVSKGIEVGKLAGFYLFIFENFDNLDSNKFHTTHKSCVIESYDDFIMNKKFKVTVTKYDDNTINMSFAMRINERICGVVDIQKFGARSKNDYYFNEIEPFLNILINASIENKQQENLNSYTPSNVNPDEILSDLKSLSTTEKIILVLVALFFIAGIVCMFTFSDYVVILIFFVFIILIFLIIFAAKRYKNKKYTNGVDFEYIKQDIIRNCISYPEIKTYFTDNYIITNYYHGAIIKYDEVIWIYPCDKYVNDVKVGTDLVIYLKKGRKIGFPEYLDITQIIYNHNPNILIGYNRENKLKYKQLKNQ